MTVNFKFNYTINIHDKHRYVNYIEKDGLKEEVAFNRSLMQINRDDIKAVNRSSDGYAIIVLKSNQGGTITTVEAYDEVLDTIQNANTALKIMNQNKVYIFDEFEVDSDELNVCNSWSDIKDDM